MGRIPIFRRSDRGVLESTGAALYHARCSLQIERAPFRKARGFLAGRQCNVKFPADANRFMVGVKMRSHLLGRGAAYKIITSSSIPAGCGLALDIVFSCGGRFLP